MFLWRARRRHALRWPGGFARSSVISPRRRAGTIRAGSTPTASARSSEERPLPRPAAGRGNALIQDLTPLDRRGADAAVQAVVLAAQGLQLRVVAALDGLRLLGLDRVHAGLH